MDTVAVALTVGSVVVTSATAFWVASLHRRQMRQNELFRIDQSAGVKIPLNAVERFLKEHALNAIFLYVAPVAALVYDGMDTKPITRGTVIRVSMNFTALLAGAILTVLSRFVARVQYREHDLLEMMSRLVGLVGVHGNAIVANHDLTMVQSDAIILYGKAITTLLEYSKALQNHVEVSKETVQLLDDVTKAVIKLREHAGEGSVPGKKEDRSGL